MSANITKTEYLKRYLENDKQKKRKKKSKSTVSRLKILHEDIDIKSINFKTKEDKVEEEDDDVPIVAEIIDERPAEVKMKELYASSKWKKIAQSPDHCSDDPTEENSQDNSKTVTKELTARRSLKNTISNKASGRHDSDSDSDSHRAKLVSKKSRSSDSDCSPPRKRNPSSKSANSNTSDLRESRNHRHDSDSDISPPRHKSRTSHHQHRHGNRPRNRRDSQRGGQFSDSDLSPERTSSKSSQGVKKAERRDSDSDLSPPRPTQASGRGGRPAKTLSGLSAGLQNAETLRKETSELRDREKRQINQLDDDLSGRNASTVVRDRRTGNRRDLEEEQRLKELKERQNQEKQEKYSEWGKGIEQGMSQKTRLESDLHEMSKPLARYADDEDLDKQQRAALHDEDPMLEFIKKKRIKEVAQTMPEYKGPPPPPNRFGIKPGYRWDGVDRSNGFEKRYFEKHSNQKAMEEEAYLWSVQNM